MAWLRTVPPEEATGRLRKIYDMAIGRAGSVYGILRAMSLSPRTLDASMGLYAAAVLLPTTLSRREREMLAVVVSKVNECHY